MGTSICIPSICVPIEDADKPVSDTEKTKHTSWIGNKDSSIVIVGAGPAGIHMGSLLKEKGFKNITILEKGDRIGGKSWTIYDKVNDTPQEMGTCFTSNLGGFYDEIYKLFDKYDTENKMIDLPDSDKLVVENNGDLDGFEDYLYEKMEEEAVPKWLHFLPDKLSSAIPFIAAANKYCEIHQDIFGEYDYSALPEPKTTDQLELINLTLLEFLNENKLEAMVPMFLFLYTMFGYGALTHIPAYYGLWWFKPQQVRAIVNLKNLVDKKPTSRITSKGFQTLWIAIADECKLDVKYNVNISHIGRRKKISIEYTVGDDEKNEDSVCECDVLFIACDAKESLKFLNATEEESKIFNCIQHLTLSTSLIEFKRNEKVFKEYKADNLLPTNLWSADGSIVEFRMTQKVLNKEEYDKGTETNTAIVKQFLNSARNEATEKLLKDKMQCDLKDIIGIEMDTVKEIQPLHIWRYFPHYSLESIQNGYPWRVRNQMQGKYGNTYYIGSSICFESVKDVVEYNIQLMHKIGF